MLLFRQLTSSKDIDFVTYIAIHFALREEKYFPSKHFGLIHYLIV